MASSSGHGSVHGHQGHKQVHSHQHPESIVIAPATSTTTSSPQGPSTGAQAQNRIVSRKTLQNIAKTVDPNVQIDEETEDMLLGYSDDFMEQVIEGACRIASHRKAANLECGDIELFLERSFNMWISTDPNKEEPAKPPKKVGQTEAHRQRIALIKKTLKKY